MSKNYTITINQNDEPNTPPFSAYCKEWDIITDDFSIPEVLSGLFAAIKILEDEKKEKKPLRFRKKIDFQISVAA